MVAAKPPAHELPRLSAELLESVLQHIVFDAAAKPCESLVQLHAEYLLRLAYDVIFLESYNRSDSTPVIARAMLETLFKLALFATKPQLAALGTLLETE